MNPDLGVLARPMRAVAICLLVGGLALAGGFALVGAAQAQSGAAVLRGLDKVTGHARDFRAPIGEPVMFGSLRVVARSCSKRAPEETPEVSIYLEISDTRPRAGDDAETSEPRPVFSGWVFASTPGLNALEHPVYDVWAIDCRS